MSLWFIIKPASVRAFVWRELGLKTALVKGLGHIIAARGSIFDPTGTASSIPMEHVERVTYQGSFRAEQGIVNCGVHKLPDGSAEVLIKRDHQDGRTEYKFSVAASAKTLDDLKRLFTAIGGQKLIGLTGI